jgi:hypothetical protein
MLFMISASLSPFDNTEDAFSLVPCFLAIEEEEEEEEEAGCMFQR